MHVESALVAQLGDVGRKLHTARSRNDQVRPISSFTSAAPPSTIDALLENLQRAFVARSDRDLDVILPGYTHLQRAQPVMAVHYGSPTARSSSAIGPAWPIA